MISYLVTGGAGFIGSAYIRWLLQEQSKNDSMKIIILDNLTYAGNLKNLPGLINSDNLLLPTPQTRLEPISIHWDGAVQFKHKIPPDTDRLQFKLRGHSAKLTAIETLPNEVANYLAKKEQGDILFVIGSICDQSIVNCLVKSVDYISHFAAETHVDRSILNPDQFIMTDIYGTYVLLEAARKNTKLKKIIHVSTDEIYGPAIGESFSEEAPLKPSNPYSASKAAADRMAYAYHHTYQLPINIVRPSNNYGPHQYPEKLIPLMVIRALQNKELPVYGDGKQVRDWLFVEDTVQAIQFVLLHAPDGEIYNIAGHDEKTNLHIIDFILEYLRKPTSLISFVKDRPGHDRRYSIDDSKLRKELGCILSREFDQCLRSTIAWYCENQSWWQEILEHDQEYQLHIQNWYRERLINGKNLEFT